MVLINDSLTVTDKVSSGFQGLLVGQRDTLPTPSADFAGLSILYTGTDAEYEQYATYTCNGTAWVKSSSASSLRFVVADALPDVSEAEANVVYSVPDPKGGEGQKYREWYVSDGEWEELGNACTPTTIVIRVIGGRKGLDLVVRRGSASAVVSTGDTGIAFIHAVGGTYTVDVAGDQGYASVEQEVTVAEGELKVVTITLPEAPKVEFTVIDPRGLGNENGRIITLSSDGGKVIRVTKDGKASFTLDPGTYAWSIDTPRGYEDVQGANIQATEGTQEIVVNLNPGASLTVTVNDNASAGGENGCQVFINTEDGRAQSGVTADGKIVFYVTEDMEYTVDIVPHEGYLVPFTQKVMIAKGEAGTVTFDLDRKPLIKLNTSGESAGGRRMQYVPSDNADDTQYSETDTLGKTYVFLDRWDVLFRVSAVVTEKGASEFFEFTPQLNKAYEFDLIVYDFHVWGYIIDQTVADPFENVTYIGDNEGFKPMRMNADGTSFDAGDWPGQDILERIRPGVVAMEGDGVSRIRYQDRRDITKLEDGSEAPTALGNDWMVEFPIIGLKVTQLDGGDRIKIEFTNKDSTLGEKDGFSYWHMLWNPGGSVKNNFYFGQFLGTVSGTMVYSAPNTQIGDTVSPSDWIKYCRNRGSGYDMCSWSKYNFISALFVLFFKTTHGQVALGQGDSKTEEMILTNNIMTYNNDYGMAGNPSSELEKMSFLWINDYWGNWFQWMGGAGTDSSRRVWYSTESTVTATSDKLATGLTADIYGYVSRILGDVHGIFVPVAFDGAEDTYYCDYGHLYASRYPRFGGYYDAGSNAGPFRISFQQTNAANKNIGGRLSISHKINPHTD